MLIRKENQSDFLLLRRWTARAGFTLIEALVAVGIIGLLLAISLPAVQQARAAARRMQCASHLRQIAAATQNYVGAFGVLPTARHRQLFQLLPFLEQQALFEKRALVRVPVFECPADGGLSSFPQPMYNYLVNSGSEFDVFNGIVVPGDEHGLRLTEISDGLSNTAFLAERLATLDSYKGVDRHAACMGNPLRCVWHLDREFERGEESQFAAYCDVPENRTTTIPVLAPLNRNIWSGDEHYYHIPPPNSVACYRTHRGGREVLTPTSLHAGGVNLALCDGSVHFISSEIDLRTWGAMGSRAGNDSVGAF